MPDSKSNQAPVFKGIRLWGISLAHALVVLLITFLFLNVDFVHGDEAFLIRNTAAVLKMLLPEPDKPDRNELAFINVAWDKQLVDRMDEDGFPGGKIPITDRAHLTQVLKVLNESPDYKYLICDVVFLEASPQDSALSAELHKLPRAIFSYQKDENGIDLPRLFPDLHSGMVDFAAVEDEFIKYKAVRDSVKGLPVRMFEDLSGGTYSHHGLYGKLNGKICFNEFVLNYRIRDYDLKKDTLNYPYVNLYELAMLVDFGVADQIKAFCKDRIVVIGDFEANDMHPTMFPGVDMAGPLILLNIYYALLHGDMIISPWFLVFWISVYLFLSIALFRTDDRLEKWIKKRAGKNHKFLAFLMQSLSYMVILAAASVTSFILFDVHISFFFITLWFNLIEALLDNWASIMGFFRGKKPSVTSA